MYVLYHRRGQLMNTNKIYASRRHFLYQGIIPQEKYKDSFSPVFHSVSQREYRWWLYVVNLQYSKPDTLLHYITIHYFIFLVFLIFCTIRKQNVGKAYVVCAKVDEGEVYE